MSLIQLLVLLLVMGVVWYLISAVIPLPQPVRMIAMVVLAIIACVWLLDWAGITTFHLRR